MVVLDEPWGWMTGARWDGSGAASASGLPTHQSESRRAAVSQPSVTAAVPGLFVGGSLSGIRWFLWAPGAVLRLAWATRCAGSSTATLPGIVPTRSVRARFRSRLGGPQTILCLRCSHRPARRRPRRPGRLPSHSHWQVGFPSGRRPCVKPCTALLPFVKECGHLLGLSPPTQKL